MNLYSRTIGRSKEMAGKKNQTLEEVRAVIAELQRKEQRLVAQATLHEHAAIKKVNESVRNAVQDTGADESDVRIADLKLSSMDLIDFYRDLKATVEKWSKHNATYRNPDNPEDFWYSPDGKGNPPKWLKALVGPKPTTKKQADMDKWLDKAEKYKVASEDEKKAA
jgi:hypothetical protein